MNVLNPYEKYRQQSVLAATPGELTLMLYEGCIKFLKLAKVNIEAKNLQDSHNNIEKANNIILELMSTLDMNYSISEQMLSQYVFIHQEINEVNMKKDAQRLIPVIGLVTEFRDVWKQAIKKDRVQRYEKQ